MKQSNPFGSRFVWVLIACAAVSGVAFSVGLSADTSALSQQGELDPQNHTQQSLQGRAPVVFNDQQVINGTTASIDSVTLPDGGFVAIFNNRLYEEGAFVDILEGSSTYLAPGTHQNVTVDLGHNDTGYYIAVPYRDTNGDEQFDPFESQSNVSTVDGSYYETLGRSLSVASVTFGTEDDRRNAPASVSFHDQSASISGNNATVVIDSATLPDGGFISIDGTFGFSLSTLTVGASKYLPPGTHENVTIDLPSEYNDNGPADNYLAVVHNDTNGNQQYDNEQYGVIVDESYRADNGLRILDNAFLASGNEMVTPTDALTETEIPTETPTAPEMPRPATDAPPTTETTATPSQQKTITIKSTGDERASYEFAVVGNITYGDKANPVQAEFPDTINPTTSDSFIEGEIVSGSVAEGGEDDYTFTGPIWDFAVDGPAEVYVNGEPADPGDLRFTPPAATPTSPSTDSLPSPTPLPRTTQIRSLTPTDAPPQTTLPINSQTPQTENEGIIGLSDTGLTALVLLLIIAAGTFGILFADSRRQE